MKGAFKRFGFCPRGTIGLWNDLGDAIRAKGGEIWLDAPAKGIRIENGVVTGVDVERNGAILHVPTRSLISNIGPRATVALPGAEAIGGDYINSVRRDEKPTANIVINFATRERLVDAPGLITFGRTRRLCNMGELTAVCPELAPEGWHLYVAYAVPIPAIGEFDERAEIEASLADLKDEFSSFSSAKILSIRVMRDAWPPQRACSGYDLSQATPIANLWHVGDAVKDYGDGGTQACAETGRIAAQKIAAWLDSAPQ